MEFRQALKAEPKELVDLTLAIGQINVHNRIATFFSRPPDPASKA